MKKIFISVFFAMISLMLLTSCGGGSDFDEGTQDFTTVYVYTSYDADLYEADAAKWSDVTPDDGKCDGIVTYEEDDVNITVTSTAYPKLPDHDITLSPVKITGYTVEFIPLEDSPPVPTKQIAADWVINPNTVTTIPVRVIDQEDKISRSSPLNYTDYLAFVAAGGVSYEYTILVKLNAVEVLSGIDKTIPLEFSLHYFDIADDCT